MKESLGSHVSSYETVRRCVSAIKNGLEETDDSFLIAATSMATDERHKEKVKSVLERKHSAGESKRSCKMDSTCDQRTMRVLLATIHPQRYRNEASAFPDRILTVTNHGFIHLTLSLKDRMLTGAPKQSAWLSQRTLKVTDVMFFSRNGLVLDHPVPIGKTVSGHYYSARLQVKVRRVLCRKRELRGNCVILLQDNATPHRHSDVQYLVERWG